MAALVVMTSLIEELSTKSKFRHIEWLQWIPMSAQIGQIKKLKDVIFKPVQGRTLKIQNQLQVTTTPFAQIIHL